MTKRLAPLIALVGALALASADSAAFEFRADDWVTECSPQNPGADCSIVVPFRQRSDRGAAGSFALAIDLQSGVLAIVGNPSPIDGRLQIDRNLSLRCTGPQYCLFAPEASAAARAEMAAGSIALIDVRTQQGTFHSSVSVKGYRAGLAKILASRYPPSARERRRH